MDVTNQQSIEQLLGNAQATGAITNQSMSSLIVGDIGQQISAGLHIAPDNVQASELVLVGLLLDDSSSIQYNNNAQNIRDGYNLVLQSLRESTSGDDILIHTRYLNGTVLYPFVTLDQAVMLDDNNYDPTGGTPLYDQIVVMLGTMLAQTQCFMDNGQQTRAIFLVCTDGQNAHSRRHTTPESVKPIIDDMLSQENYIIAGYGVDSGDGFDFRDIFARMGILPQWILTSSNDVSSLRNTWQLISRSVARVSQSSNAFSNSALGGFEL